jgi:hypothetical protein
MATPMTTAAATTTTTTTRTAAQRRHPNLYTFLLERLPQLGLDVDTYGPYIWGVEDNDHDENKDDDDNDVNIGSNDIINDDDYQINEHVCKINYRRIFLPVWYYTSTNAKAKRVHFLRLQFILQTSCKKCVANYGTTIVCAAALLYTTDFFTGL